MERRHLRTISASLATNVVISWTILPFAIPPFRGYSLKQLLEVLLWQGMGTVGWPLAIPGALVSMLFNQKAVSLGPFLLTLMYPAMLFLVARAAASKVVRRWELPLLHFLLASSFAAVWYHILNGYDFMVR